METYGQEPEIQLLCVLMSRLEHRNVLDIGAEHGSVTERMLDAGAEEIHAFEPHPDNARVLHSLFDGNARVKLHELAVSDGDGSGELHTSSTPDGRELPFGHTFLERDDTPEIAWRGTTTVPRRSLASLAAAGEIPTRIGIVKIDTEGHDLAVVQGMEGLEADAIMVEHWADLPNGLGLCPWQPDEMVSILSARGFSHFAFLVHRGEFVTMKWGDAGVEPGAMGNILFLHDRVVTRVLPDLLECASTLAEQSVYVGQMYMDAARDRLELIAHLEKVAVDRLAIIDRLTAGHDMETSASGGGLDAGASP
jgi:FkbM family methyltransferase